MVDPLVHAVLTMKTQLPGNVEFQGILERKEAELVRVLRTRDGIAIEKSAALPRQVKTALQRVHDGSFGNCIDCDSPISPIEGEEKG